MENELSGLWDSPYYLLQGASRLIGRLDAYAVSLLENVSETLKAPLGLL